MKFVFALFSFFMFLSCKQKKQKIVVIFKNVNGLREGAEVKEKGLPIGSVYKMDLHDSGIAVTLRLIQEVKTPVSSSFLIQSELIGSDFIEIIPSETTAFINHGDTVYGIEKADNIPVVSSDDSLTKEKRKKALGKIKEGVEQLLELNKDSSKSLKD